VRIKSK